MTRIEHRSYNVNVFCKHFNILTCTSSAPVPAVRTVNVNSNRRIYIASCIAQERHKSTFLVHTVAFPAVRSLRKIVSVCRETYVVKLNFVKTARNKFLCNRNVIFPHVRTVRVDPVFVVVKRIFPGYLARFLVNNIFVSFYSEPRRISFVVPHGIFTSAERSKISVFKYDNPGNKIHVVFLEFLHKMIKVYGILRYFSL